MTREINFRPLQFRLTMQWSIKPGSLLLDPRAPSVCRNIRCNSNGERENNPHRYWRQNRSDIHFIKDLPWHLISSTFNLHLIIFPWPFISRHFLRANRWAYVRNMLVVFKTLRFYLRFSVFFDKFTFKIVWKARFCFGSYRRGPFALFAGINNPRNYDIKAILLMINPFRKLCVHKPRIQF